MLITLLLTNKINAISNLTFLINTTNNVKQYINNSYSYSEQFLLLLNKIKSPITKFVSEDEIRIIDKFATEFISVDFNKRGFKTKNYSAKLLQMWSLFNDIYSKDPAEVPYCITHVMDKRIPKTLTEYEKTKFLNELVSKFSRKAENVNHITDLIFNEVKHDYETKNLNVLSICGLLISFVLNAESHLYFVVENVKETKTRLGITGFDVEDIFSIEKGVIQNTLKVTDVNAIRNAVSHGAFDIKFDGGSKEYIIDFQSILNSYSFNRKYSGSEFLDIYRIYDNLRNIQELFIRMAFLKATLRLFFFRN
jgi:hypothetical protein